MTWARAKASTIAITIALLSGTVSGIGTVADDLEGSKAELPTGERFDPPTDDQVEPATDGQPAPCGDRQQRPPILIETDLMFNLGPAVGVVNPQAAGTADDPYIIEGWCIGTAPIESFRAGIELRDTTAHVVVRDNVVDPDRHFMGEPVPVESEPLVNRTTGIALTNAENVKVADNTIPDHSEAGLHVNGSSAVRIVENTVEKGTQGALIEDATDVTVDSNTIQDHSDTGLRVNRSSAVRIARNTIENNTVWGAWLGDSTDVTLESNAIQDHPWAAVRVNGSSAVRIAGNTIEDDGIAGAWLDDSEGVSIASNRIANHSFGIFAFEETGTAIEGNTITGTIQATILSTMDGLTIVDNAVRDNSGGLALWEVRNTTITTNNVTGHNGYGVVVFGGDDLALTQNRLTDNGAPGTDLFDLSKATVTNNTVTNNSHGIRLFEVASGRVDDNAVTGNDEDALELFQAGNVSATGNNVEDNGGRGLNVIGGTQPVDARDNWWGDATGPSGNVTDACTGTVADGDGAEIFTDDVLGEEGEVCFDPWLEAPNPDAGVS